MLMMFKFLSTGDFGKSKEQIQQELEAYGKLIFPLGDQHKERIRALLFQIDNKKLDQIDLMVGFIEGKQRYLDNRNIAEIYRLIQRKQARLSPEQIRNIIALIILDTQCDQINQLPTLAQIQNFAKSIDI